MSATGSASPQRLLHALAALALFATIAGVGRHGVDALLALRPAEGGLAAVPPAAWLFAGLHLAAGVAALGLGYLAISLAYPRRHLAREAAGNPAAAVQAGAHLLGAAAVATASWGGCDAASLPVSAAFCLLGWAAVAAISAGHRLVTRYRDHEEIAAGNLAAAIASAGLHLAVAIVVSQAIQGQFDGWERSLTAFAVALVWAFALWPLRQLVLARLMLRLTPAELDRAVAVDRDAGLGAVEGLFYVLAALCLAAGG